jgi:hypothetical protein
MSNVRMKIAAVATALGLGGLAGFALSSNSGPGATAQAPKQVAEHPRIRTQVVHRTVHVPAKGGPAPAGSGSGPATTTPAPAAATSAAPTQVAAAPVTQSAPATAPPPTTRTSGAAAPATTPPPTTRTSGAGVGTGVEPGEDHEHEERGDD